MKKFKIMGYVKTKSVLKKAKSIELLSFTKYLRLTLVFM